MSAPVQLVITHRDGRVEPVSASAGSSLMEALRDANTGVEGTCGGAMSCGTCHVYIDSAWQARCGATTEDETAMLEAIGDFVSIQPGSRLSCQIELTAKLDGLSLSVAPAV